MLAVVEKGLFPVAGEMFEVTFEVTFVAVMLVLLLHRSFVKSHPL